jgi:tRNA-splicing ligase RtcB
MNYALDFAAENRRLMMERAMKCMVAVMDCGFEEPVNIHHNYAALERHFGESVWIHRKGATAAHAEQKGIVPGSMGTPSYIVEGLGNPESFTSCSHGAGRKMGRNQASRTLTREACDEAMEGIVFGRWNKDRKGRMDFGEAPQAYKDIEDVIASQRDLIRPLVKLQPLGVIKG